MTEADPLNSPPAGGLVLSRPVERRDHGWNEALSRNGAAALCAPDAVIESPLIAHLRGKDQGLCRGQEESRAFGEH